MSWGIDFQADIFLGHITIASSCELDQKIEETEQSLRRTKEQMLMYTSSNPKDVTPDDWRGDGLMFLHGKLDELLLQYEQDFKLLIGLNYYKDSEPFKEN